MTPKKRPQEYFTSCVSVDRLCVSEEPGTDGSDRPRARRDEGKRKQYQTRRLVIVVWHVLEQKLAKCGRFVRSVRLGKRTEKAKPKEVCANDRDQQFERLLTDEERRSGWMPIPQGIPNCPPGLEYLTAVDQLLVHQQVELLEAFTGFETANKYTVKNTLGQKVYWAVEDTTCCTRMCCGPDRPFDIKIMDNFQNEVLHLRRDLRCKSCCFPCCLQKLEVSAPPGNVIGTVVQKWSLCRPVFDIRDRNNETVLTIRGPVCQCPCSDIKFAVFTKDGTEVGKVTKQWTGFVQEHFTDADNFGINFPMDLDVRVKATMLGALFLIDYMYFESSDNKKVRR
ncbi:AGAP005498-PC [Anopheles gambiae str. PEST]|nr:AGAP005498-PC [Anopheles gambiae str. PEST]